jgi:integrase/recombinase XerD
MYKDIFESIRNEAEKRNLRERTIQLYCSDVSYFLRWIGKNVSDLLIPLRREPQSTTLSRSTHDKW